MFAFCVSLFNIEQTFIKEKNTQTDIHIHRLTLHEAQFPIKVLHREVRRN
jgi:hypothetical protein